MGEGKFQQMDQATKKLKTMLLALHWSDDMDRLYVWRIEGDRAFANFEESVDAKVRVKLYYIKKSNERPITAKNNNTYDMKTNKTMT